MGEKDEDGTMFDSMLTVIIIIVVIIIIIAIIIVIIILLPRWQCHGGNATMIIFMFMITVPLTLLFSNNEFYPMEYSRLASRESKFTGY